MPLSATNFVSTESSFDIVRRKNFYMYAFISSFVWMCFHFTVVYFFGLQLNSALLVGLFLGFGNLVAFLVDGPIGILQKYFSAKTLFLASTVFMLFVSAIFMYFIFSADIKNVASSVTAQADILVDFLTSGLNIILLLGSVVFYGLIKELSDVTSLSYVLNNADPSEYSELLSKNNIFSGLGSLTGVIISGIILGFNLFAAVVILVILIALFLGFIMVYFDSSKVSLDVDLAQIKRLKIISPKETLESVKQYAVEQIQKADFRAIAGGMKFIFLKPMQLRKQKIDFRALYQDSITDFKTFYEVLFMAPLNYRLLLMVAIVVLFGFWDTFVVTFLIEFLNKIIDHNQDNILLKTKLITGYIFIAILCVPAFGAQLPFINLSKRVGSIFMIMFGIILSGISVFLFGISSGFFFILFLGILNSFGYAAAMPLAMGEFSDLYNQIYAEKLALQEIDSNASSAPLKMVLNMANVFGLVIGGFLIAIFGFNGTFFVFGLLLVGIFATTIIKRTEWNIY